MKALRIYQASQAQVDEVEDAPLEQGKVRLAVKAVGICGSDLHYFFEGRCGNFEIKAPFVCGHEASATVLDAGGYDHLAVGQRVAINPGHACGHCRQCRNGKANLCENLSFFGTASTWPHSHGFLRQYVDVHPEQCLALKEHVSFEMGACAEPLAVAIHAIRRAADMTCKQVAVLGAGPIGVLIAAAAKAFGAQSVTVTDLQDKALGIATAMGADSTINVANQSEALNAAAAAIGGFDVVFEVTGAPVAFDSALQICARGGTIVQVGGLPASVPTQSLNKIMVNEISYHGSMRFNNKDYADAVTLINDSRINLQPMLTRSFEFEQATEAFDLAKDRNQSSKVHVLLNTH